MKKIIIPLALCFLCSCQTSFLELNPDGSKVVPQSLEDVQAILDNTTVMNLNSSTQLALIGVDEYSVSENIFGLISSNLERQAYIWEDIEREDIADWNYGFKRVLYANIALETLAAIQTESVHESTWKEELIGTALFFRSLSFYDLSLLFCPVYNSETAAQDLGLPLKLISDIEYVPQRASLADTYLQIISDLEQAIDLLPQKALVKERPDVTSARALLARIYLYMGDYGMALKYASAVIETNPILIDFSTIDRSARYPFPRRGIGNNEVLFMYRSGGASIIGTGAFNTSPKFLSLFEGYDFRREAYLFQNPDGRILFKGSFSGEYTPFTGLSTGETYLILAECLIRGDRYEEALVLLNHLRSKRYRSNQMLQLDMFPTSMSFLYEIFLERKRELFRRGLYWSDLKRLNRDGLLTEEVVRAHAGEEYRLSNEKYTWPIPESAVVLSGLEQNR